MAVATRTSLLLPFGRIGGATLLAAMATIHLYLWFDRYAEI